MCFWRHFDDFGSDRSNGLSDGFDAEYYQNMAEELHEREREIKAARGEIVDRNGVVLATNRTVCTISVIHSQIKDPQQTADMLSKELELDRRMF